MDAHAQNKKPTTRSSQFFLVDHPGLPVNLHLKVEDELFAIPTEVLRRRSRVFKELTDRIGNTMSGEGSGDQQAISLDTGLSGESKHVVHKEEFSTLCRFLMGGQLDIDHDHYSIKELEHLLKLANIWRIPDARRFAIQSLDKALSLNRGEDAAQRFRISFLYQVGSWFLDVFKSLARKQFLTANEMEILGPSWVAHLMHARDEWLSHRKRLVFRYQQPTKFPDPLPTCLEEPPCATLWPYVWQRFVSRLVVTDECAPGEDKMEDMLDADYAEAQRTGQALCMKCYVAIKQMIMSEGILAREQTALEEEAAVAYALQAFPPEWSVEEETSEADYPASD